MVVTHTKSPGETARLLRQWQHEGLITSEQVTRIEAAEAARGNAEAPASHWRNVTIGESLGYVGSALIAAAVVVLVGREWHGFTFIARISITAGLSLLLLAVGAMIGASKAHGPAARVRAVLWTASAGLAMGALSVLAVDGFSWSGPDVVLFAAGVTAVYVAALWRRCDMAILHIALFLALAATAGAAAQHITALGDQAAGVGVWVMAVGWLVLARRGLIAPQELAVPLAALAAILGAQGTMSTDWGSVFAVATTAAVVTLAVWQRSLVLLVIGAYGLFTTVPAATERLLPGSVGVGVGLLTAGVALVVCAMQVVRGDDRAGRGPTS